MACVRSEASRTRKRQSDERPGFGLTSSGPKKSQVAYQLRLTHDRTYLEYKCTMYQFLGLCWRRFDSNSTFTSGMVRDFLLISSGGDFFSGHLHIRAMNVACFFGKSSTSLLEHANFELIPHSHHSLNMF